MTYTIPRLGPVKEPGGLKFAAMNLKKLAIRRLKDKPVTFAQLLLLWPINIRNTVNA